MELCSQVGTCGTGSSLSCWLQRRCISGLGGPNHGFSNFRMGAETLSIINTINIYIYKYYYKYYKYRYYKYLYKYQGMPLKIDL